MGKLERIKELERRIGELERRARLPEEVMEYIGRLAELPEDAVLFYRISGQSISHEIGKSARVLLGRLGGQ